MRLRARTFLAGALAEIAVRGDGVVKLFQRLGFGFRFVRELGDFAVPPHRVVRRRAELERSFNLRGGDRRGGSLRGGCGGADLVQVRLGLNGFQLDVAQDPLCFHDGGGERLCFLCPEPRIGCELAAVRGGFGGEIHVDPRGSRRGLGAASECFNFLPRDFALGDGRFQPRRRRAHRFPRRRGFVGGGSRGIPRGLLRRVRLRHRDELGALRRFSLGAEPFGLPADKRKFFVSRGGGGGFLGRRGGRDVPLSTLQPLRPEALDSFGGARGRHGLRRERVRLAQTLIRILSPISRRFETPHRRLQPVDSGARGVPSFHRGRRSLRVRLSLSASERGVAFQGASTRDGRVRLFTNLRHGFRIRVHVPRGVVCEPPSRISRRPRLCHVRGGHLRGCIGRIGARARVVDLQRDRFRHLRDTRGGGRDRLRGGGGCLRGDRLAGGVHRRRRRRVREVLGSGVGRGPLRFGVRVGRRGGVDRGRGRVARSVQARRRDGARGFTRELLRRLGA